MGKTNKRPPNRNDFMEYSPDSPPNKKLKTLEGLPSGTDKNDTDSPSAPAPDTPSQPKKIQHPSDLVPRNLIPGNKNEAEDITGESTTSPEAKLLKQLKELSKMKPRIEDCLENEMTGSVNLLELFSSSDSNSKDAWKKAGRGLMLLKEGLTILNEAENLLSSS